ncbi:MAG: N-acetylornithine carbamoyltransferase [Bacteroidales bacterium]
MKKFTSVSDAEDLQALVKRALEIKKDPLGMCELGKNKTMLLIFFNNSLRTRLSTQKAALNLGMNVIVFDINEGGWKLETEMGVIMDGDKPEHLREAVPVIGSFCDIIGVRSFASLSNKEKDYNEVILSQFVRYAGVPVVSLESATLHPLQSLADIITIEEHKIKDKPKIVMSWAPHPRALPQAVPNSFAEWVLAKGYDLTITHPVGYELSDNYTKGAKVEHDQMKAFENADFVYAKNWSSFNRYGDILSTDRDWTVSDRQMAKTNDAKFMHCLPVRRNMIVSDSVIDGKNSLVIPEAANRLYSAQAVIETILKN